MLFCVGQLVMLLNFLLFTYIRTSPNLFEVRGQGGEGGCLRDCASSCGELSCMSALPASCTSASPPHLGTHTHTHISRTHAHICPMQSFGFGGLGRPAFISLVLYQFISSPVDELVHYAQVSASLSKREGRK